jgi:SAM-dependent methyltransferase
MPQPKTENINSTFFDGRYKEIWRSLIPEGLTKAEVDFLIETAGLRPGSKVLDLMCGYGRHAVALARKGIHVTAIDNLGDYINEVKGIAANENLPITCIQGDVTDYEPTDSFDLVICLGNNLSFFDQEETEQFFSIIGAHTKLGGLFIAKSWTIAEIVFKSFTPNSWSEVNGLRYLVNSKVLFHPTRIEMETIITSHDGEEERKKAVDYVYSLNEMETLLTNSGFSITEIWSIPGKKKFTLGEPRAYIVCQRM